MNRFANPEIGSTPTEVARQGFVDLGIGWIRAGLQEGLRAHDLPGLAIATLCDVEIDPGLLELVEGSVVSSQALDRDDIESSRSRDRKSAGPDGLAIGEHGAGPAHTDPTSELRPDEAERIPQDPEKRRVRIDLRQLASLAIDLEPHPAPRIGWGTR